MTLRLLLEWGYRVISLRILFADIDTSKFLQAPTCPANHFLLWLWSRSYTRQGTEPWCSASPLSCLILWALSCKWWSFNTCVWMAHSRLLSDRSTDCQAQTRTLPASRLYLCQYNVLLWPRPSHLQEGSIYLIVLPVKTVIGMLLPDWYVGRHTWNLRNASEKSNLCLVRTSYIYSSVP